MRRGRDKTSSLFSLSLSPLQRDSGTAAMPARLVIGNSTVVVFAHDVQLLAQSNLILPHLRYQTPLRCRLVIRLHRTTDATL